MGEPDIPETQPNGQVDPTEAAAYVPLLWQAWDDCYRKIEKLHRWDARFDENE